MKMCDSRLDLLVPIQRQPKKPCDGKQYSNSINKPDHKCTSEKSAYPIIENDSCTSTIKEKPTQVEPEEETQAQNILNMILRQIYWGGFVPANFLRQSPDENTGVSKDTDNFLNEFVQKREFQILLPCNSNLTTFNGLDALRMILKYSNEDFDFGPLLEKTEEFLFSNTRVNDWVTQQFVSRFDDVYVILAALILVCKQNQLQDFVSDLNLFLLYSGIQLDLTKLELQITGFEQIIVAKKKVENETDTDHLGQIHSNKNRYRTPHKAPSKQRVQHDVMSVSHKSKAIRKSSLDLSNIKSDSNRHKNKMSLMSHHHQESSQKVTNNLKQQKLSQSEKDQNCCVEPPDTVRSIYEIEGDQAGQNIRKQRIFLF